MQANNQYDVIVVGAGPVGLTFALFLGQRGVRTLVVEQEPNTKPFPRADRLNARTMEYYRKLGIAERIRALGFPADMPMNVYVVTRLCDPPLVTIECASVTEYRRAIGNSTDGTLPLEPYQLVAQNDLESLLREAASRQPTVDIRFGHRVVNFTQSEQRVVAYLECTDSLESTANIIRLEASYLVGCDGAHSTVRRVAGIELEAPVHLETTLTQVIFQSWQLFERMPVKGRHYYFMDGYGSVLVVQGNRREFILHTARPPDNDWEHVLYELAGFRFDIDIRFVFTWHPRALVASRFRAGRIFLAGDAAHLVTPWGGLGANTGIGDAANLSFKLTGALEGWGGPLLLESYEKERHPVALRNAMASAWAFEGAMRWRTIAEAWRSATGEERERLTTQLTRSAREDLARYCGVPDNRLGGKFTGSMLGLELGYSYTRSPVIISADSGDRPVQAPDYYTYAPSTRPGASLPHMWLKDGRAVYDLVGDSFAFIDFRGNIDGEALKSAFESFGAPLHIIHADEPRLCRTYGYAAFLVRPDLHIVWRGNSAPQDPRWIAAAATGWPQ